MTVLRIALFSGAVIPYSDGGAERTVAALCDGLRATTASVSVYTRIGWYLCRDDGSRVGWIGPPRPQGDGRIDQLARLSWHLFDTFNPFVSLAVYRELRRNRPDYVFTHLLIGLSVSVWLAARLQRVDVVHTLHDYYLLCRRSTICHPTGRSDRPCAGLLCGAHARIAVAASRAVGIVVGVGDEVLAIHRSAGQFRNARCSVISPRIEPPLNWKPEMRTEMHYDPQSIGYLGRLSAEKGVFEFITAASKHSDDVAIRIAGAGPMADTLLEASNLDARIRILGRQSTWAFLESICVLVVPSIWPEPYGRVVAEAAYQGVPVVTTRRGGPSAQVLADGNGLVVEGTMDDVFLACISVIRDAGLRRKLAAGCMQYASRLSDHRPELRYIELLENRSAGS